WMQPRILNAGHESDVSVALRRTGTVGGTVSSPVASTGNLSIRFDAAEGEPLSGEAHCASDAAAFACTIPQGVFDIRVSLPGHVPVYKRHVPIEPDHRLPLGDIRLVPGASISGFVKAEAGTLRDPQLVLVSTSRPAATLTANVDAGGFFSVGPIAAGDYTLKAFQKGLISPELKVTIRQGLEARLRQPLLLARPRRMAVSLLPPTDPLGGAWFVRLLSTEGERPALASEGSASLGGLWSAENLPAGEYQLRIRPARGPIWFVKNVKLTDLVTTEQVAIEAVRFRGMVQMGKKPLAAKLIFGGEHGANPIPFDSDENGEFHGFLPAPEGGKWRVTVKSATPHVDVMVEAPVTRTDSDIASIAISVPSAGVEGVVLGDKAEPEKYALVSIRSSNGSTVTQTRADDHGDFSMYGLAHGDYVVVAQGRYSESEPAKFHITESDPVADSIRLQLQPYRRWQGTVIGSNGIPVAGARIDVVPVDVDVVSVIPAATDA